MSLELGKAPDNLKFRALLRKVQSGDEQAVEDLYDWVDAVVAENTEMRNALKSIHTTTKRLEKSIDEK